MAKFTGYLYIGLTIFFTVYGQIVLKWRMNGKGSIPLGGIREKLMFIVHVYSDIWVLSCFFAGFLASIAWMAAMTKFDISYAYPFTSLSFLVVTFLSAWLFHEEITVPKGVGLFFVLAGLFISTR
jgi:multidrug transporter EmrE-like cation transporter